MREVDVSPVARPPSTTKPPGVGSTTGRDTAAGSVHACCAATRWRTGGGDGVVVDRPATDRLATGARVAVGAAVCSPLAHAAPSTARAATTTTQIERVTGASRTILAGRVSVVNAGAPWMGLVRRVRTG